VCTGTRLGLCYYVPATAVAIRLEFLSVVTITTRPTIRRSVEFSRFRSWEFRRRRFSDADFAREPDRRNGPRDTPSITLRCTAAVTRRIEVARPNGVLQGVHIVTPSWRARARTRSADRVDNASVTVNESERRPAWRFAFVRDVQSGSLRVEPLSDRPAGRRRVTNLIAPDRRSFYAVRSPYSRHVLL